MRRVNWDREKKKTKKQKNLRQNWHDMELGLEFTGVTFSFLLVSSLVVLNWPWGKCPSTLLRASADQHLPQIHQIFITFFFNSHFLWIQSLGSLRLTQIHQLRFFPSITIQSTQFQENYIRGC